MPGDQFQGIALGECRVRLVDDEQPVEGGGQRLQLRGRCTRAGRAVGVGDERQCTTGAHESIERQREGVVERYGDDRSLLNV